MQEKNNDSGYAEYAGTIRKFLGMKGSPVTIRLALKKEEVPEGIPEIDQKIGHCMMVNLARKEGRIFFAPSDKHECTGGAQSLGLREITDTLRSGQFYFKLGKFGSSAACRRTIDLVPHLETAFTQATIYAPLEKTPFKPHVVIIVANPRMMLKLAQSSLFRLGGRLHPEFSGIQSVCADVTAQTFMNGKPNFSLGCDGSRKFSGIADDEMVMGMPAEILPEVAEALPIVTQAPESA